MCPMYWRRADAYVLSHMWTHLCWQCRAACVVWDALPSLTVPCYCMGGMGDHPSMALVLACSAFVCDSKVLPPPPANLPTLLPLPCLLR